jgi:hypothetical protein
MLSRARRCAWIAALAALAFAPGAAADDGPRKQEIIFDEIPAHTIDDAPFDIVARSSSGLPLTLTVVSGPAVLDGKTLKLTGTTGLVIIRASQAGNAAFAPARDAERAFTVLARPSPPSILSGPMSREVAIGDALVLTVEASGEPPPSFQWRKDNVPITGATARALTIAQASLNDSGSYDVVATNASGRAASAPARVTVGKRHQSISFQSAGNATAGQPVTLSANASSGLPVRFEIVSGVGTLSGDILTSQAGTVVVQAIQSGDANFEAAMPVTQTFIFAAAQGQHNP